jgi:hypothetical protein
MQQYNKKGQMVIIGIVIIILVATGLYLYWDFDLEKTNNVILSEKNLEEPYNNDFYDEDICRCIERERIECPDDFEFIEGRSLCKNGEFVTNPSLACSKYECSGKIYNFNSENKGWDEE